MPPTDDATPFEKHGPEDVPEGFIAELAELGLRRALSAVERHDPPDVEAFVAETAVGQVRIEAERKLATNDHNYDIPRGVQYEDVLRAVYDELPKVAADEHGYDIDVAPHVDVER